ncbi:Hypothetical protein PHPALM_10671 [Phytophthora palmivora]|uniref:RxLR effector n=1 Tax=Phytophthora palmivora TaxID=4796 RepID=A0A2P4Y442_9STRA|nr:Hypothetical protein PHPALM_10671 [Phytophthora palmivora]
MKLSNTAIAIVLVYLVSFVTADHQPSTMTTDSDDQAADSSDQAMTMTSRLRGPSTVGVSNILNAKNNNLLVTRSNIVLSTSDRVKLAHTIKEMMSNSPEAGLANTMSTEDLFGLLTRVATTPGVLSNAAGIISAVRSGNTGAIAGHVVNLLGAALPAVVPTPAPVPVTPVLPPTIPAIAPISTPATPTIPIAPIVVKSPVSAPITPAVVAVPSTST